MSAIAVTSGQVSPARPMDQDTIIRPYIAAAAITAGQLVYVNSSGLVDLCNTASAGKQQCRGVALQTVGAQQGVDVLQRGEVEGFAISSLAYDVQVYASDTAGNLDTAVGTKTVPIGRVMATTTKDSSGNIKKLLHIQTDLINNW